MATQDTLTGTLFAGRYRVTRKLGGGGMADVYLAEDQELGRRVAIKILHDRYANDEQFVERFRREATHAAGLSHPNIVSIYDRGSADGSYFIVMEYVEGRTLKELIRTRGRCPIPVAIAYSRQILAALRYAHRHGVIHRDIKPHNVIVDPEGVVKVTDFGIARAGPSQMTEEGSIIGTAQYLSPEQARGAPVDQTSDLYSTGIVLYELLTGRVPFTGDTPVEIAMKHLSEVPDPPSRDRPEVPPDLDLLVLRALAKEPTDRYQSAAAMDADLETVAHGGHVPVETADAATIVLSGTKSTDTTAVTQATRRAAPAPIGPPRYEPPSARPRSLWPWLLGIGTALALAAGGWLLYQTVQNQLAAVKPVSVPYVVGLKQKQAENQITQKNLVPRVQRQPNSDVPEGVVFAQNPLEGTRVDKQTLVVISVSSGKPQVTIPNVVGNNVTSAVAELTAAGLNAHVVNVDSNKDAGTVTAQAPSSGTVVVQGTEVRINVSRGPQPVAVPDVIGLPFDQASAQLQQAGFKVSRLDVDSDVAKGIVVNQDPGGSSTSPKGASVTLSVSKGPTTSAVPDVTTQDVTIAKSTLEAAGFRTRQVVEDTSDPSLDGIVISQDPVGGTQAKPNTLVTLYVGRFTGATTTTPTTPTTTTPTTPTTP
jgi:beta-lactam-binding protein with PASTA domain/predicted Ser/Thr protein kinase